MRKSEVISPDRVLTSVVCIVSWSLPSFVFAGLFLADQFFNWSALIDTVSVESYIQSPKVLDRISIGIQ